ncbi:hypothetical protein IQ270_14795 [Microcoleus sp. LEGE 07076]|uniref:hypothetical protein n=1 Tax=Microcoleus sp. LEGE 07076 TaxID=915322 RepID=UPI00187F200E|nr:hypothetical protein [Microcoleus sp. LEGE 07076]MBE9185921.1 hypothetical protein [Microcoleus sp. LEGE 07076]
MAELDTYSISQKDEVPLAKPGKPHLFENRYSKVRRSKQSHSDAPYKPHFPKNQYSKVRCS